MSQPFRDEYAAALDRAEVLSRENDELREEVARIRADPGDPQPPGKGEPLDMQKARTLQRLEDLSQQISGQEAPRIRVASSVTEAPMLPVIVEAKAGPIAPSPDRLRAVEAEDPLGNVRPELRALMAVQRVKELEAEVARLYLVCAFAVLSAGILLVLWLFAAR
jgi:hypothetical protein